MIPRIKIEHSAIAGDGVKPVTEDWVDATSAGSLTLATDATLGFHDRATSIAVGPKGDAIVWAQDAGGLYLTSGSSVAETGGLIIHPAACSLRYDPYFEIVTYCSDPLSELVLGLASEAVGDHGVAIARANGHRSVIVASGSVYDSYRGGGAALIGAHVRTATHYYRTLIQPEDGGLIQIYDLGASPADYNGGTIVAAVSGYVSRGLQLQGGNVIAPYISPYTLATWYADRIVATRTTLRRP